VSSYHSEEQTLARLHATGGLTQLPVPGAAEIAHSNQLIDFLIAEIEQHAGVISFRDYMSHVLYRPDLGYYSAGLAKFGIDGDFVTAPEISDLFGRTLARQCESIFEQGCARQILEFGAGSGRMCEQILLALAEPCQYRILELSADLRGRQQDYLQARLPGELFDRIDWLEALPTEFDGIVLGNEVLDAMPVHLLRKDRDWFELGVGFDGRRFCWRRYADGSEAVSTMQLIESSREILADGYTSEINLNYHPWLAGLRDACNQVIVLMIDYGYPQEQYYHPERAGGTLVCHYHHRVHYDPLIYPGLQDVTASVDFDAFADAALLCGFDICGLTTQARFLLANGLLEEAACAELEMNTKSQLELAQQIKTLSLPGEMGDRFKVIGLQKNLDIEIGAFCSRR